MNTEMLFGDRPAAKTDENPIDDTKLFDELDAQIVEIVRQNSQVKDAAEIKRSSVLKSKPLCCDELDVWEIVMAIEERFNVEIADEEGHKLDTVQSVLDLARSKRS